MKATVTTVDRHTKIETDCGRYDTARQQVTMKIHFGSNDLSAWRLDPDSPLKRQPTRPRAARQSDFEAKFDYLTVCYDVFHGPDGKQILLLGPPTLNLQPMMRAGRISAQPSGVPCPFELRELNRHAQIWISAPEGTEAIAIESDIGSVSLKVQPNYCSIFENKRVIVVLSKDNSIDWIIDWARFYQEVHGADAVLIYDNDSTEYTSEELHQRLKEAVDIDPIVIVSWPYLFGPIGNGTDYWDSNFCQIGALEHARWRLLQNAKSVINADIDELVIAPPDHSVFEMAERSREGLVAYGGVWVVGVDGPQGTLKAGRQESAPPRYKDFKYAVVPNAAKCPNKWTVVPQACPPGSQWTMHRVLEMENRQYDDIVYRHFAQISTSWKYDRTGTERYDARRHVEDIELTRLLTNVFGESPNRADTQH